MPCSGSERAALRVSAAITVNALNHSHRNRLAVRAKVTYRLLRFLSLHHLTVAQFLFSAIHRIGVIWHSSRLLEEATKHAGTKDALTMLRLSSNATLGRSPTLKWRKAQRF
ncbi:hypothetical protein MUK42_13644 [Musa troglodytarum]|uniref:Uncharacterized protein n=1 Tax=Musa troglodytarum TaxID=320322 RepID=A0A9E7LDB0_9LILI|nr:hypothetical protein MUK42_13644 [Musa troglodytarum]